MSSWLRWDGEDVVLTLRVVPRASHDEFAEPVGDAIKLRLTAPPIDGRANAHLVAFLAGEFGVAKRNVRIERGHANRIKCVRIRNPAKLPTAIAPRSSAETAR